MLDVVEAVSHQSGRPEPAVTIIEKVPLLQKSLFNSRILSAISTMSGILGIMGIGNWIRLANEGDMVFPSTPIVLIAIAIFLRYRYHSAAHLQRANSLTTLACEFPHCQIRSTLELQ